MFVPIGASGISGRRPWTTIGLVAANVVAFVVAWPPQRAALRQAEAALAQLAGIELSIEQRYLPPRPAGDLAALVPSRLRKRATIETRFWEAFDRGEVVDLDHPDRAAWEEAERAWERTRSRGPYWTWAVRPGTRNPLAPFTAMFLHFGFWHLFFNMIFLWAVGVSLEEVWGTGFYLLVYLLGGVAAEVANFALASPFDGLSCGASGAVAALMGAFLARFWNRRLTVFFLFTLSIWQVPAWTLLGYWFLSELWAATGTPLTDVAHWAHVGGFVGGGVLGLTLARSNLEAVVGPEQERRRREADRRRLLRHADERARRGDGSGLLAALEATVAADPHDADVRLRLSSLHAARGDDAAAWAQAEEALRLLWLEGRRAELADTFRWALSLQGARPSPALLLRAAEALAESAPLEAARAAWTALEARPEEPLRSRALSRYADLLERLGDAERAGQVRRLLAPPPD